jgi:magnesium chelatase subunit I
VKTLFSQRFPDAFKPRRTRRGSAAAAAAAAAAAEGEGDSAATEYRPVLEWFASGNHIEIADDLSQVEYEKRLKSVRGLAPLAEKYLEPASAAEHAVAMELVLEGLHQHSMLSRERVDGAGTAYKDMLKSMLSGLGTPED